MQTNLSLLRGQSDLITYLYFLYQHFNLSVQFSLVAQLRLFVTPWAAACQASLFITNSRSLLKLMASQWCHPIISSSLIPFSCLQFLPASGSFKMSQFFTSGGQSIGVSASASVPPMNTQDWFPLGVTWSSCSPRDSQESSPTPRFKSINSLVLSFFYGNIHRSIFSLKTYTDLYFP